MAVPSLDIITLNTPEISDFAAARNAVLKQSKAGWVFFLDSDERMTAKLKAEIEAKLRKPGGYSAFYVRREDTFLGKKLRHGETGKAKFIRLARRHWGAWERPVHEVWVAKDSTAGVGELTNPLLHVPHPTIASFLQKINRYSTLEASYRYRQGKPSSLLHIIFYPAGKFLYNYVLLGGFLDGVPGMIMAAMMSFHSYLTWTKLYLLWQKH